MNAITRLPAEATAQDKYELAQLNRHEQLGAFLRARRESLDPVRLGIPRSGRRRTPGLRREDVAALADIGLTWYTKLEQGRPIQVSGKVLAAIAEALQCNAAETHHLFNLAGMTPPEAVVAYPGCEKVSKAGQRILDQLNPLPAIIQNSRFDILGFNQSFCELIDIDLGTIPIEDRNCIYLAISHPGWQACLSPGEDSMPRLVALFRAAMAEHLDDPVWEQLLQRFLTVSEAFRQAWQHYEVNRVENRVKKFLHPERGILTFQQMNWWSAAKNGDRLMVYVPVEE